MRCDGVNYNSHSPTATMTANDPRSTAGFCLRRCGCWSGCGDRQCAGANVFAGGTRRDLGAPRRHGAARVRRQHAVAALLGVGSASPGRCRHGLADCHARLPGRRIFEWRWCCCWPCRPTYWPMSIPTSCSSSGRCRRRLRETFGWQKGDHWFPDVRTLGGAVTMFVCVLYPYAKY